MKQGKQKTDEIEERHNYISPSVEVIKVTASRVICQSGSSINDLNPRDDDSRNWN